MAILEQYANTELGRRAQTVLRFLQHLWRDFWFYGCQKSAAALTYMTLFAIVPLMTVFYFVFTMVPSFADVGAQLQELIFSHFVPVNGQDVRSYLEDFSQQAKSLTGFGVGMLVVTAYLMLTNIEKTFNDIWGVERSRRGLSSFLLYWAVLSLGPLLIGLAFAVNTYLLSLVWFVDGVDALGIKVYLIKAIPVLMMVCAFTLLFIAVPNCRVPFRYALTGGFVTAVCFEAIKDLFTLAMANSSFQLVYGAFAVVPLFLLWINLTWTIILTGAIFVRTLAEKEYDIERKTGTDMVNTLRCLDLFVQRQRQGRTVSDKACYKLGFGVVHWQQLRQSLEKHRWITRTSSGRYALTRNLEHLSLWELADVLEVRLHDLSKDLAATPETPWLSQYLHLRAQLIEHAQQAFSPSLAQVLAASQASDPELTPAADVA